MFATERIAQIVENCQTLVREESLSGQESGVVRAIEAMMRAYGFDEINIDRYGNTSSASVPILLDEMNRAGKIHEGDLIILAAFGGGLSAGAMIIRW